MLAREMMHSLRYGTTGVGARLHILRGDSEAYCGRFVLEWEELVARRTRIPICLSCLRITDKVDV